MKLNTETYSDFWLDDFDAEVSPSVDTAQFIRMNAARRAVSNFVNILTEKTIPIVFNSAKKELNMTDGKVVYLSADIVKNKDFDPAVGLALHEGSHILLSDFDIFKTIWQKVPSETYKLAETKGFSKTDATIFVKNVSNYVEDRYIDAFVYNSAPGYRGYYLSLYDKYFNSKHVSTMLKSDMYRTRDIESYESRLINLTNKDTDLDALPGLREIVKVLDLNNILRLNSPMDRLNLAIKICNIIYDNIDKVDISGNSNTSGQNNQQSDQIGNNQSVSDKSDESDDVDDILGGESNSIDTTAAEESKQKAEENNKKTDLSENKQKCIKKALERQKSFLDGNVKKSKLSAKDGKLLSQLDEAGCSVVNVGRDIEGFPSKGIDCIVVKNLTKDLLFSEQFPCFDKSVGKFAQRDRVKPTQVMQDAINRGIRLGNLLGHRLKIRSEVNVTKYMRRSSGKIDRRVLSELGFENDCVFYKNDVDQYNNAFIHISVDASSSMTGRKWLNTITSVTAICKAASMINNVRVSVSLRTTQQSGQISLPYVVLAYDSLKDSFSKIRNLFPFLGPNGCTPEGLCFEAIMNLINKKFQEEDCYFLNFSDGEPAFRYTNNYTSFSYDCGVGGKHTRKQVNLIRDSGFKVMSYYIKDAGYDRIFNNTEACFKLMYGQDARFIDVVNVVSIAKTMNQMFLEKVSKY